MSGEHQREWHEGEPQAHDFYQFGMEVAWYLCGCRERLECIVHLQMPEMLEKLASGEVVLANSPSDFRACREANIKKLKINGKLPEDLMEFDPDKFFRQQTAWHRRLARIVLESGGDDDNNGDE